MFRKAPESAAFASAIERGDTKEVQRYRKHICFIDKYGRTPLHYAILEKRDAITELLLQSDSESFKVIDRADENGKTPLHYAAQFGRDSTVELLLRRGSRAIDTQDKEGLAPLHLAAWSGNNSTLQLLLQRGGLSVDAGINHHGTPLHYAASQGRDATVELLLHHGCTLDALDYGGKTPLHWAAENGITSTVELLLRRGSALFHLPNSRGRTPLWYALYHGNIPLAELLYHAEQQRGHTSIDTPDHIRDTPLLYAIEKRQYPTVDFLLQHCRTSFDHPSTDGKTPLHVAIPHRDVPMVTSLMARCIRVDSPDNYGRTPLHIAVEYGNDAIVELLLRRSGASIDQLDKNLMTPLHRAVFLWKHSTVRILKVAGATKLSWVRFNPMQVHMAQEVIPEDESLEIRFRIYFRESLCSQLLECTSTMRDRNPQTRTL